VEPESAHADTRRRRFWAQVIKWSLVMLVLPPLLGCIPTVWSMLESFREVQRTGQADPVVVAEEVSTGLKAIMIGMSLACPACFVLLIALIRYFSLPKVGAKQGR
jgi:biopolymer transport protein ExbB/TolQ